MPMLRAMAHTNEHPQTPIQTYKRMDTHTPTHTHTHLLVGGKHAHAQSHGTHKRTPTNTHPDVQTHAHTHTHTPTHTHLLVGGKHAHVQSHGTHDGGGGTPEQTSRTVFTHDAHKGVAHTRVVAALLNGECTVSLY